MKVHPVPRKRNITLRYDIASTLSQANAIACRQKKLRRLPHIFAKVLELPFHSDADVSVEETADYLKFVVATDDVGHDVRAHTLEIYPGVTKILIWENDVGAGGGGSFVDGLELDLWRFRLPASTRPRLATAAYVDGELVVTVPKGGGDIGNDGVDEAEAGDIGGPGQLVLVQPVRKHDAEKVVNAEIRNKPDMAAHPGGVGASMAAAAAATHSQGK